VEQYFRICISFNIIGSLVEFVNDGFLLGKVAKLVKAGGKIAVFCMFAVSYSAKPDGLLQELGKIFKELFLLFTAGFADLVYPFQLGNRSGSDNAV